jgi:hypothetical protein
MQGLWFWLIQMSMFVRACCVPLSSGVCCIKPRCRCFVEGVVFWFGIFGDSSHQIEFFVPVFSVARYPLDHLPLLMPLLLSHGSRSTFEDNVDAFCSWLSAPPPPLRPWLLPAVCALGLNSGEIRSFVFASDAVMTARADAELLSQDQMLGVEGALTEILTSPSPSSPSPLSSAFAAHTRTQPSSSSRCPMR